MKMEKFSSRELKLLKEWKGREVKENDGESEFD
jgi:hypothetical protein